MGPHLSLSFALNRGSFGPGSLVWKVGPQDYTRLIGSQVLFWDDFVALHIWCLAHRPRLSGHYITVMSRAFVKEDAGEAFEDLPDRPVSDHPNYVTAEGLAFIESELARAHQEHATAQALQDTTRAAKIARDLRYWQARRASARVIAAPTDPAEVRFGSTVVLVRDDGREQRFRIVGEDEADPAKGTLSHAAPLARALFGKKIGDVVAAGSSQAEIVKIS